MRDFFTRNLATAQNGGNEWKGNSDVGLNDDLRFAKLKTLNLPITGYPEKKELEKEGRKKKKAEPPRRTPLQESTVLNYFLEAK